MTTTQALPKTGNNTAIKLLHLLSEFEYDESVTEPISQILKAMKRRVEYEAQPVDERFFKEVGEPESGLRFALRAL